MENRKMIFALIMAFVLLVISIILIIVALKKKAQIKQLKNADVINAKIVEVRRVNAGSVGVYTGIPTVEFTYNGSIIRREVKGSINGNISEGRMIDIIYDPNSKEDFVRSGDIKSAYSDMKIAIVFAVICIVAAIVCVISC